MHLHGLVIMRKEKIVNSISYYYYYLCALRCISFDELFSCIRLYSELTYFGAVCFSKSKALNILNFITQSGGEPILFSGYTGDGYTFRRKRKQEGNDKFRSQILDASLMASAGIHCYQ